MLHILAISLQCFSRNQVLTITQFKYQKHFVILFQFIKMIKTKVPLLKPNFLLKF